MPIITLFTNVAKAAAHDRQFGLKFSTLSASCLKKPHQYIMTNVQTGSEMTMGGTDDPCAHISISSIGSVTPSMNKETCAQLTELVASEYKIAPERIYIVMMDTDRSMIGLGGRMFDDR